MPNPWRILWWLLVHGSALAALLCWLAASQPHNTYDAMPIKCGAHLRETCPSTGVQWERR